jgi:hypothetical protein
MPQKCVKPQPMLHVGEKIFVVKLNSRFCKALYNFLELHPIDILYKLDSASLLVKLKPRIFQRLPPFE